MSSSLDSAIADIEEPLCDEESTDEPENAGDGEASASAGTDDDQPGDESGNGENDVAARRRWWGRRGAKGASDGDDDGAAQQARPSRKVIRWAAAVVFVAVVAGAGYEGWLLLAQHQQDAATRQALEAAQKYAVTLTSTDPNAVDQNFTDVLNGATGEFKDNYTKASAQLRKLLIDNKVSTQGSVVDSAVKTAAKDKVEILLFVRQSVSNSTMPQPRADLITVAMTMQHVDGRWLAANVILLEG
jgi:Mce-associated membrane protein